jgi:hypothetical protein
MGVLVYGGGLCGHRYLSHDYIVTCYVLGEYVANYFVQVNDGVCVHPWTCLQQRLAPHRQI